MSMFGGWCLSAGSKDGGEHATDKTLIEFLKTFFKGFIFPIVFCVIASPLDGLTITIYKSVIAITLAWMKVNSGVMKGNQ